MKNHTQLNLWQNEMSGSLLNEMNQCLRDVNLLKARSLFISEAINSSSAKKVVSDLLTLDAMNSDPIYIYINSPGGEINSGFSIYDTINYIGSEVKVISTGLCASIATIINVAAKKENRFSMPNARFLIHQPLISEKIYGQATDIEITANEMTKTKAKINRILAEECSQDLQKIEKDTQRDYWMSPSEALEYGLIHKIIENKKEILNH